ncbi:MAG: hypothetical protein VB092_07625 [Oscillospiraceae bacterium]|nr:hypothetical protein [Oscillospiraceae bacterium]
MRQKRGVVVVGAVTIFAIFTVLLLVTFSALSFVLARTDADRADRAAQTTAAYYAADAAAWERVDEAAALLADDPASAAQRFTGGQLVLADGRATVTLQTPVCDALTLYSEVELLLQDGYVASMHTVRWQCAPAQE